MDAFKSELIKYNGIDTCNMRHKMANFKHQNINTNFCLSNNKVDISDILEVWGEVLIVDYEVIQTPKGISLEDQIMTGYNIFIYGNMNLKVKYISNDENQSINTIIPFANFLAIPEGFNQSFNVEPDIFIEDIFVKKVNSRCIYINITFISGVDIYKVCDIDDIQRKYQGNDEGDNL